MSLMCFDIILWRAAAGNRSSLLDLKLANNMLSGSIPSAMCTLANLTSLNMSSNQLSGALAMPTALTFTTQAHWVSNHQPFTSSTMRSVSCAPMPLQHL